MIAAGRNRRRDNFARHAAASPALLPIPVVPAPAVIRNQGLAAGAAFGAGVRFTPPRRVVGARLGFGRDGA